MRAAIFITGALALTSCGGGGGNGQAVGLQPISSNDGVPPEQYIGFLINKPPGQQAQVSAMKLDIESGNLNAFSGQMSFSWQDCIPITPLKVSGSINSKNLSGAWSGSVDGIPQNGALTGNYDYQRKLFTGTYSNSLGSQSRSAAPGCESTVQQGSGEWIAYPFSYLRQDAAYNLRGILSIDGSSVLWKIPQKTAYHVIAFLVRNGSSSIPNFDISVQKMLSPDTNRVDLWKVSELTSGVLYRVVVSSWDNEGNLLGIGFDNYTIRR
jgi:hypothetical protein